MKWYQEMLGSEELEKDPSLAGIFPLVLEDTQIAYNVVYEPAAMLPETGKSEKKDRINIFSEIENIQQVMEKSELPIPRDTILQNRKDGRI